MRNPVTPGTYPLNFVSYYNTAEISSGTDFAKIDEEHLISFTYVGVTLFDFFKMEKLKIWQRDACPNHLMQAPFRFKVRFT